MVELGSKNNRMRDFFDIQALAAAESFKGAVLSRAISETFGRRKTAIPGDAPLVLTREFAEIEGKGAQWAGFVRRLPGTTASTDFAARIAATAAFAGPVLTASACRHIEGMKRKSPRYASIYEALFRFTGSGSDLLPSDALVVQSRRR
jgi:hypothetical protein